MPKKQAAEDNNQKDKKVKTIKKKKDPNAPKKGMTGFLHFVSENRMKVKQEHPNKAHKEVISELGKLWSHMTQEQRIPYEDKATADKLRYNKQKLEYEKLKQGQIKKSVEKTV